MGDISRKILRLELLHIWQHCKGGRERKNLPLYTQFCESVYILKNLFLSYFSYINPLLPDNPLSDELRGDNLSDAINLSIIYPPQFIRHEGIQPPTREKNPYEGIQPPTREKHLSDAIFTNLHKSFDNLSTTRASSPQLERKIYPTPFLQIYKNLWIIYPPRGHSAPNSGEYPRPDAGRTGPPAKFNNNFF